MDSPVRSTNLEPYFFCLQRFSLPVMPHSSVPSDRFHRHTDPALPDPVRARHVLTWCASRSAPRPADSQTRLPPLSPANAALLASLQDQVVKQLADATIDISLYSAKSKERPPAVENPQNERNRAAEGTLLAHEERCVSTDTTLTQVTDSVAQMFE
jgi:kinetochore protein Mis13/DSN1